MSTLTQGQTLSSPSTPSERVVRQSLHSVLNAPRSLTAAEIATCRAFAEACYETNADEYARRNQDNRSKIVYDITIGKMAELAVYGFLTDERRVACAAPDFGIYPAHQKSYGADLTFTGKDGVTYDLHVKSQDQEQGNRFGKSWMFQKKDTLTTSPKDHEMICLCTVINGTDVQIEYIHRAKKLVPFYSEPKSPKLKDTKTAIYAKDLD
jgi:hypothetical protein